MHARQRVIGTHDRLGVAQIGNRFEQRRHDQRGPGTVVEGARQQAAFLLQQQHFEQVADVLGVRNDVVAHRVAAIAAECLARRLEHRQLALRALAVGVADHAQRPRVVEQGQQQRAPRRFVQRTDSRIRCAPCAATRRSPPRAGPNSGAGRRWPGESRTPARRASTAPAAARSTPGRGGGPAKPRSCASRRAVPRRSRTGPAARPRAAAPRCRSARAASPPAARRRRSAPAGTARPRGADCDRASARPARASPASPAPASVTSTARSPVRALRSGRTAAPPRTAEPAPAPASTHRHSDCRHGRLRSSGPCAETVPPRGHAAHVRCRGTGAATGAGRSRGSTTARSRSRRRLSVSPCAASASATAA